MELLSSSSDDDECGHATSVRVSTPRASSSTSTATASSSRVSSSSTSGPFDGSFGATDHSEGCETELMESLLASTPRSHRYTRPRHGSSPYTAASSSSDAPPSSANKPVISARAMLLKMLPKSSAAAAAAAAPPPVASLQAASSGNTAEPLGATAAADGSSSRRASPALTPTRRTSASETVSASERIALKYGLMRSHSPAPVATPSAPATDLQQHSNAADTAPSAVNAAPTPVVRTPSPAAVPRKPRDRSSYYDTNVAVTASPANRDSTAVNSVSRSGAAAPAYVSPFASKDGLANAKRRRQQHHSNEQDRLATTSNGNSVNAMPDSASLDARDTGAASLKREVVSRDLNDTIDSDDGWMSDAKDVAQDQLAPKRGARASPSAGSRPGAPALPLERVPPRSLKRLRTRESRLGDWSDDDEETESECWPRLPPPEVRRRLRYCLVVLLASIHLTHSCGSGVSLDQAGTHGTRVERRRWSIRDCVREHEQLPV